MRAFLARLLLFLLPGALLAYPLDRLLSRWMAESHAYPGDVEVWNDIYSDTLHADLVVHGSSRAWMHFDTPMIQDSLGITAYNLGVDGQGFRIQYLRHQEYMDHAPAPKVVLMLADMQNLHPNAELYGMEQFLPFMAGNQRMARCLAHFEGFGPLDFQLPLVRFAGQKDAWRNALLTSMHDPGRFRRRGYAGMDKEWTMDQDSAEVEWARRVIEVDPELVVLYEAFLQDMADRGITVVLVDPPEFRAFQVRVQGREQALEVHRQAAARFGLTYLDYSDHPICLDRSLFYNATHLNRRGATLFTAQLIRDLRSLGIGTVVKVQEPQ